MGFSEEKIKILSGKLNAKHVRTRVHNGFELSYIEGWHAIAEANRVFGFDGWDRETLSTKCVWERNQANQSKCSYIAQVRIRVRAGNKIVCREASGSSIGESHDPGEAHEQALKGAETDATKRALTTFGNLFGLALYDKDKRGVRGAPSGCKKKLINWQILGGSNCANEDHSDPVAFCTSVRSTLESLAIRKDLTAFWNRNRHTVDELRKALPDLKTDAGRHYGDVLEALYCFRRQELTLNETKTKPQIASSPCGLAPAEAPDSTDLSHAPLLKKGPRRIRDKDHLKFVSTQSCLVCGRTPSQAHHLRDAQIRTLGRKVSDEFTVPLCAIHHRELHDRGNEIEWWERNEIEPRKVAEELWSSRART